MKGLLSPLVAVLVLGGLVVAGASQAASPPAESANPTKAQAPQPTAAPKVDFPGKGRTVTFISPWAAGSSADIGARVVAAGMEKQLGVPVQVVNRPGASGQVGLTNLVRAKPDGYTVALTNQPNTSVSYVDTASQAIYGRKDFQPVGNFSAEQMLVAVKPDSPYKTIKDLVDAAKAKPNGIKVGSTSLKGMAHLGFLTLEKRAEVRFGFVHFDGSAPAMNALLGGHVDATSVGAALMISQMKGGNVRVLGIFDREENPAFPGVKTLEAQGYKVYVPVNYGVSAPAGVPREIVDILSDAIRRTTETADFKSKMKELGRSARYMNTQDYIAYWDETDALMKPLLDELNMK